MVFAVLLLTRSLHKSFEIIASVNTSASSRSGTVTVTAPRGSTRRFNVTQEGTTTLTISPDNDWITSESPDSRTIRVTANVSNWTVSTDRDWLRTRRIGNDQFEITVPANTSTSSRSGTVTVTAPNGPTRIINVTQAGAISLTISPSGDWNINAIVTNTREVTVTTVAPNWSVSAPTWLNVSRTTNNRFVINPRENTGSEERRGTITVTAPGAQTRTKTVIQRGTPSTLGVNNLTINNRPPNNRMQLGLGSRTLTANRTATWQVANENIARITTSGVLTPRRVGSTAVIATCRSTGQTTRFTLTVDPLLLYQSQRLPGLNEDGSIADDMRFNNRTHDHLFRIHDRLGRYARVYSNSIAGPIILRSETHALAASFTLLSLSMWDVAHNKFNHFFDGSGNDWRNIIQTDKVFNHDSTGRFIDTVRHELQHYLNENNGTFRYVRATNSTVRRNLNETRPLFTTSADYANGLLITIHDTWGNNIELLEFNENGRNIEIRVRVTIYDHFGLDTDDVTAEGRLDGSIEGIVFGGGFAAWYVLQHYRGTNNRHNPFISYFEREFTFTLTR